MAFWMTVGGNPFTCSARAERFGLDSDRADEVAARRLARLGEEQIAERRWRAEDRDPLFSPETRRALRERPQGFEKWGERQEERRRLAEAVRS